MKKYRMVGFDSLPTYSNNDERGIIMENMEVRILESRMMRLDKAQEMTWYRN